MATITPTSMTGSGDRAINETTLTSSDTFVYNPDKNPVLILSNNTAGALTPNIDGDGNASYPAPGIGYVDVSGGFDLSEMADGDVVAIPLNSIRAYLSGTIEVTGGTGIVAQLLEF